MSNGFQRVWVGETRYVRMSPDAPWRLEAGSSRLRVPRFDWDSVDSPSGDGRIVALRLVGEAQIEDKATHVVTFFMQLGQNPIWFRVWVDADGLVHRAEMRTQAAHFMDLRYYDFDAPFTIEPPVG
ncbi:MAG: hypothetical protein HY332_17045 [Chloroflexi bacterium]|nr:hypothetical protein [Chloroflexota bacterium]